MQALTASSAGRGSVGPLLVMNKPLGGGDCNYEPGTVWPLTLSGQKGVVDGSGLNNIGLLVRTCGRIIERDTSSPATWLRIDDGSGVTVKCTVPDDVAIDPSWTYVAVTGISSIGDDLCRLIRTRTSEDITPFP
jgi:hypothetical protein